MADEDVAGAVDTDNPAQTDTSDAGNVPDTNDAPNEGASGETILANAPEGETAPVADWPDDWRAKLAGDDAKALKRLDRFKSVADIHKSWLSAEKKLSSGQTKEALPDDPSDEQLASYRKDNGIPETAEGYLSGLTNGLVIGDEDKALVGSYLDDVHGMNADPAFVAKSLEWYYGQQEKLAETQAAADKEARSNGVEELRGEWGGEFKGNINAAMSFLDAADQGDGDVSLKDNLMGARMADGTLLGDSPAALRWLVNLANDANPAGFVSPAGGGSQSESIQTEIEKIEGFMRTDRNAYNKDEKMQARLRKLYDAEEKLASK